MSVLAQPIRFLHVDDDENFRRSTARCLASHYEIVGAADGVQGLQAYHDHGPFPLVLSDHAMAGMDGATMVERLAALDRPPVSLLLTGYPDAEPVKRAVEAGAVFRVLEKPLPTSVLMDALHNAHQAYLRLEQFRSLASESAAPAR